MDAFDMLRQLLAEDRAARFDFDDVFADNVRVVCREARAPASWADAVLETAAAWRSAYEQAPSPLSKFDLTSLIPDEDSGVRQDAQLVH